MLHFQWYKFSELTLEQLYAVLALRVAVFVVEQNCPYADLDGRDSFALHLLGVEEGALVAYARLFLPTEVEDCLVFGRVLTAKFARTQGYGKQLIQELLDYCDTNFSGISIKCSAQFHLQKFYESLGFKVYGDVYDEDGIPHIAMLRIENIL